MPSLPRFLALSLVLLLALLVAAVGAQVFLRQQEQRLHALATKQLEERLRAAVELTNEVDASWSPRRLEQLSEILGARISRIEAPSTPAPATQRGVSVEVAPDVVLHAEAPTALTARLQLLLQRLFLGFALFGVVLMIALFGLLAGRRRAEPSAGTTPPFASQGKDALSLATLAKTSVLQQAELDRERDERLRAEAEARVRLQLLNRALEEKIRIGRDLHDGVIQSLYAAGLTLQSAQAVATKNPAEAAQRVESTLDTINRTIAEIRGYIGGLAPVAVRGNSLARALDDSLEELRAGREVTYETRIDETAAARLTDDQMIDTLQVTREAVSNALRHGAARRVQVSLGEFEDQVVLDIVDDGAGFDPLHVTSRGYGLANMRGRAERSGGFLTLTSAPGVGAHVRLVWTPPLS